MRSSQSSFRALDKYKKKYHEYKPVLEANKFDDNSQDVTLYPKLPVICKKNDQEKELINNEQFVVSKLTPDSVYVKNDERELRINIDNFQEFFYPAYCITIHKSQGCTYNFPYTIHEFHKLTISFRIENWH